MKHRKPHKNKNLFQRFSHHMTATNSGRLLASGLLFGILGTPLVITHAQQLCTFVDCTQAAQQETTANTEQGTSGGCTESSACTVAASTKAAAQQQAAKEAAAATAAVAASKASSSQQTTATADTNAAATPSASLAPPTGTTTSNRFGIAAGSTLSKLSSGALASQLDDMKAMGVGWVRFDLEWSNIESNQGSFNWGPSDAAVRGIRDRGMKVLAVIDYTPAWARIGGCNNDKCAPADPAVYGAFAGKVAARYAGYGVSAYEIWNEPNSTDFYRPAADAAQYTLMLKSAYSNIKSNAPSAQVITGGTAPRDSGGGELSPIDFVQGLYAAGAKDSFDGIAAHPYTFPVTAAYPNSSNAWGQLQSIRNTMVQNGDSGKQVWSTEYGSPTGGPGPTATLSDLLLSQHPWHVDEPLQAQTVTDAIRLHSQTSWKGPFMWYTYKDSGTSQSTNENFFGLVRADGSRKPAYEAFVQALKQYN